MTTLQLMDKGIGHNCLSDAYDLGKADGIDELVRAIESRLLHFVPTEIGDVKFIAKQLKKKLKNNRR